MAWKDPERARAYFREWKKKNADKVRGYDRAYRAKKGDTLRLARKAYKRDLNLRTNYGVTASEFESLAAAQSNKCAICAVEMSRGRGRTGAQLDHNHSTKKTRGVLCHGCNTGIGLFREDVESLRAAVVYLDKHR